MFAIATAHPNTPGNKYIKMGIISIRVRLQHRRLLMKDGFFKMTGAKEVKFIFVCPNKNEVFESSDFKILDNRGIVTDEAGNKILDAKVAPIDSGPAVAKQVLDITRRFSS